MNIDRKEGRAWFLDEMNRKAQTLGMLDPYFFNPTGLDEETKDKTSFSTALDLLALSNYALKNPIFGKITNTTGINIAEKAAFHRSYYLENILQLSRAYDGIKGIKPGNSIYAKETLSSYIERDGRRIITVILGSNYTKDDVLTIYRKFFGK